MVKCLLGLVFLMGLSLSLLVPVLAEPAQTDFVLPSPPASGTPKGNSTPGTTRPIATCPETLHPLTALIANNTKDYTISDYPSFWFYIPYPPEQLSQIEFILLNGKEDQTIYRGEVNLLQGPGLIKLSIPQDPQYALRVGELYHWYLMLDCYPDSSVEPDLVVDGWIRRRESFTSFDAVEIEILKSMEAWYDIIHWTGESYFQDPVNPTQRLRWYELTRQLGFESLKSEGLAEELLISIE